MTNVIECFNISALSTGPEDSWIEPSPLSWTKAKDPMKEIQGPAQYPDTFHLQQLKQI
jgi:hypothetical protein